MRDKDHQIQSLRQHINDLRAKGNLNVDQLRREKEVQISEIRHITQKQLDDFKRQYESEIESLKQDYNNQLKELERKKKSVARSISNRRNSVSGSQPGSSRRHSSVKQSRNKSSRGCADSFTVESRYPKKRGIGEQTPPRLDFDQYPTKDKKHD